MTFTMLSGRSSAKASFSRKPNICCMGFPDIYEHSGAIIKLNPDGTANLSNATVDMGSGQITTLCQIAAEELGLQADQVRMTYADTETVPFDAPSHASRVTYSAGTAVKAAAANVKKRLLEVAGVMLEAHGSCPVEHQNGKTRAHRAVPL